MLPLERPLTALFQARLRPPGGAPRKGVVVATAERAYCRRGSSTGLRRARPDEGLPHGRGRGARLTERAHESGAEVWR